jgi:hypothetical protein
MIATRPSRFGGRTSMLIRFSLLMHTGQTGHKLGFDIATFPNLVLSFDKPS